MRNRLIVIIMLALILILCMISVEVSAESYTAKTVYHYSAYCKKCSGKTASGWNIKKKGIYYNDKQYGKVRICATSKKIPLYSVLEFKHKKYGLTKCIVLDRGVTGTNIDLLTTSNKNASKLGIQKKVKVNILRRGK